MIQFNLLPDVKIQFIKAERRKRLMIAVSVIVSGAMLTLFLVLFLFVRVNQAKHISDLNKDIETNLGQLKGKEDLNKILTIQNQLSSLPQLHDDKAVSSRLIDYLGQVTPNEASISSVSVDFAENKITINGTADNLITVNKFIDTLKFTGYKINNEEGKEGKAFKNVVLQTFSVNNLVASAQAASYEINLDFERVIFENTKDVPEGQQAVTLNVPEIISTRSETERPRALFEQQPTQGEDR